MLIITTILTILNIWYGFKKDNPIGKWNMLAAGYVAGMMISTLIM